MILSPISSCQTPLLSARVFFYLPRFAKTNISLLFGAFLACPAAVLLFWLGLGLQISLSDRALISFVRCIGLVGRAIDQVFILPRAILCVLRFARTFLNTLGLIAIPHGPFRPIFL